MSTPKTYDGAAALAAISGLPRAEILAAFEKGKANHRALKECAGPHDFVPAAGEEAKPVARRFRCTKCSGEAEWNAVQWYRDGLAHGRAEGGAT